MILSLAAAYLTVERCALAVVPFSERLARMSRNWIHTSAVGITVVLAPLSGCARTLVGPSIPAPTSFPTLTASPAEPVISSGRAGWPILPVDPSVYVDEEG